MYRNLPILCVIIFLCVSVNFLPTIHASDLTSQNVLETPPFVSIKVPSAMTLYMDRVVVYKTSGHYPGSVNHQTTIGYLRADFNGAEFKYMLHPFIDPKAIIGNLPILSEVILKELGLQLRYLTILELEQTKAHLSQGTKVFGGLTQTNAINKCMKQFKEQIAMTKYTYEQYKRTYK